MTNVLRAMLVAVVLVMTAASLRADAVDAARRELEDAERRLTNAARDAAEARQIVMAIESDHANAVSRAQAAAAELDRVGRVLDDAASVRRAADDARAAAQAAAEHAAALPEAQARLTAASEAVERIRAAAKAAFEGSAEFVETNRTVDAAKTRLNEVIAASTAALAQDPQYRELKKQSELHEATVRQLRGEHPIDQVALAAASEKWMEAQSAVGTHRRSWLDKDAAVIAAKAEAESADARRAELAANFERKLGNDPQLREAMAERAQAERAVAAIEAGLQHAAAALKAAEGRLESLQMQQAEAERRREALGRDLSAANAQIDRNVSAAATAHRRLRDELEDKQRAERDRDEAARKLREATEERDRKQREKENEEPANGGSKQQGEEPRPSTRDSYQPRRPGR